MKSVVKKPTQVTKTKATAGAALVAKRSSPKILVSPAKVKIESTGNKRAKRAVPAKKQIQSKFPVDSELQLVSKIKKAFEKMGDKRPSKLKSFLSHLKSIINKTETPQALENILTRLQDKNIVRIENNAVTYL